MSLEKVSDLLLFFLLAQIWLKQILYQGCNVRFQVSLLRLANFVLLRRLHTEVMSSHFSEFLILLLCLGQLKQTHLIFKLKVFTFLSFDIKNGLSKTAAWDFDVNLRIHTSVLNQIAIHFKNGFLCLLILGPICLRFLLLICNCHWTSNCQLFGQVIRWHASWDILWCLFLWQSAVFCLASILS